MLVLTSAYLFFIVWGLFSRFGQCVDTDHDNSVSCDFQEDMCGWQSPTGPVVTDQSLGACTNSFCFSVNLFQNDPWIREDIKSIPLKPLGFPVDIAAKIREIDNGFVLRSAVTKNFTGYNANDALSMEMPYSMKHRCLRYKHLVKGYQWGYMPLLAVGYIRDYYRLFYWSYMNTHGDSPVIQFSSSSVTLPVGVNFKVVFRALFLGKAGLVMISNVSIDSGICEMCDPNEFSCSDERDECIPLSKVCDLKPDCLMGEDEKYCAFDIKKAQCSENFSPDDNRNEMEDDDEEGRFIPQWHSCAAEDECSLNYTDGCSFYCPPHCTCSGLSLNCSTTHDIPKFITSITLHSLVRERIIFDSKFPSLRKIEITSCKSCYDLYIDSINGRREILINNSEFKDIWITDFVSSDVSVYRISILNSFVGSIFGQGTVQCEWNVHNSSLNSTNRTSETFKLSGNHADFSQTKGFQNFIGRFHHLVVNFSSCSLTELPKSKLETITLDLSHNKLKSCKILYFTHILYLQDNLFETINISIDTRKSEDNLQYLDLSYNQISFVRTDSFNDFTNLLYLKLKDVWDSDQSN